MSQQGPITKIYSIEVRGLEQGKQELAKFRSELDKTKKQWQEMIKALASTTNPTRIASLNQQIQASVTLQADLTKRIQEKNREIKLGESLNENNGTSGIGAAILAYKNLIEQYKEAVTNSALMEAQFGKESAEAIEAARAAVLYEAELKKISELRKNNGLTEETKAVIDNEKIKRATLQTDRQIILNQQAEEKAEQLKITTQKQSLQYQIAIQKEKLKGNSTAQAEQKIAQQAANEYYQLGQALKDAELKYKNLALTQGFQHEQTQVALKDALAIRATLDKVDGALGNHQRNVGNYASAYNGLGNSIQQILRETPSAAVSLNTFFLAISNNLPMFFDELAKINEEQKAANLATKEASILAREQAVASAIQAGATAEAAAAEGALAEQTVIANAAQSAAPGILKRITSSLFSLQSGLTLAVLLLTLFGSQVIAAVGQMVKGTKSIFDLQAAQNDLNEEIKNSGKSYNETIVKLEILNDQVNKTGKSFTEKQEILKDYNKEFGSTLGVAKDYNDVEKILREKTSDYIKAMYLRAQAQAALNLAIKEQEKVLEENLEAERITKIQQQDYANLSKFYSGETLKRMQNEVNAARKNTAERKKVNSQEAEDRKEYFKTQFEDYQKQADAIDRIKKIDTDPTDNTTITKSTIDKLTIEEQNAFKRIEAKMNERLSVENKNFNEIEKTHEATYDEEIAHYKKIEKINVTALKSKITLLEKHKILNSEELVTLAKFQEDISSIELQTSQKIQAIDKKRFEDRDKALKDDLNRTIKEAQEKNKVVQEDLTTSNLDRARTELEMDNTILAAHQEYYDKLLAMNSNYNQEALKNEKVTLDAMQAVRDKEAGVTTEAHLKDVKATGDKLLSEFKAVMAQARLNIINSEKPQDKKDIALAEVDRQEEIGTIARELARDEQALPLYKQLLAEKKITDITYNEFYAKLLEERKKLGEQANKDLQINVIKVTNLGSFLAKKLRGLFSFDTVNSDDDKATVSKKIALQDLFAETVAQTYNLAKSAMDDYYNAEAQQIERSRANNEKRLQLEFDQLKARSQSQAETESLEKQFQERKESNDRDAFEKNKKIQREQAKINLGMQLSNLAVVYFSPHPANVASFGVAGTVMYAIQAALALANYALNVGRINSAQFEKGGQVPKRGGKFGGKRHSEGGTPFIFQGEQFEAEYDEIAVVRTKNAPRNKKYQLTGTHEQIASALNQLGGGVAFSHGATVKKFEAGGTLSRTLQAPVFSPSNNSSNVTNNSNKELLEEIKQLRVDQQRSVDEISRWKDRLQVVQVTNTVTKAQQKEVTQKSIGTL